MDKFAGKNFVNPENVKQEDGAEEIKKENELLSQLILERGQTGQPSQAMGVANNPTMAGLERVDSDAPLIDVGHDSDSVYIRIDKRLIKEAGVNRTMAMVKLASGNLFAPSLTSSLPVRKAGKSCAFFVEGRGFYTGGRYSVFTHAVLLANAMNVTFLTDEPLPFERDFPNHQVKVIEDADGFARKLDDMGVDFVVGAPNVSGQAALAYSQKYKVPCYLIMFESPNFIQEFRKDGEDAKEEYWANYKKCMLQCDGIIAHSNTSASYTDSWLGDGGPRIWVTYPTWNQSALDEAVDPVEKSGVVFCSRSAPFKDPYPVLQELSKMGFDQPVRIIGKTWETERYEMPETEWSFPLEICGQVSDIEKFRIIKGSKVLAMPSKFEGFGMPPMEAAVCKTPVVAYDLPSLREVYGDHGMTFVSRGNAQEMAEKINWACNSFLPDGERWVRQKLSPGKALTSLKRALPGPLTLSVGIMVYDNAEWVGRAIRNASEYADEIIIVYGRCKHYPEVPMGDQPTKNAIYEAIEKAEDLCEIKTVWLDDPVSDKIALQNKIAELVTCDIYLKQDADEFWHLDDVRAIMGMFEQDHNLDVIKVNWYHFWRDLEHIACDAGGKWSGAKHPRFWRWRKGFTHTFTHNNFVDSDGKLVEEPDYTEGYASESFCYHTGYAREIEGVQRKLQFYRTRGIEEVVIDTYTDWKEGDPTQPTQSVNSWSEEWKGDLPEVLKDVTIQR